MARWKRLAVRLCVSAVFLLFLAELGLQLAAAIHRRLRGEPVAPAATAGGAFRIMFIGDSWTQGAEAPEGEGYPDHLLRILEAARPGAAFRGYNLGEGSFNSSEACVRFLRIRREVEPRVLVVLFGLNNGWNTQDIGLAFEALDRESGLLGEAAERAGVPGSWPLLGKSRLARLCRLLRFELFLRDKAMVYGHPSDDFSSGYFRLRDQKRLGDALEYLVSESERAASYDDLYKLVLYHFRYDSRRARGFLSERGRFHPERLAFRFDQERHDRYVKRGGRLLAEQLLLLKRICDREGISLVVQTYPLKPTPGRRPRHWRASMNRAVREVAEKGGIHLVDHERLFAERVGPEEWKAMDTGHHVDGKGYAVMAKNLAESLEEKGLLPEERDHGKP